MSAILDQIAPALVGWLWVFPVTGLLLAAGWFSHQLDLGNSAKERFDGHVVHHSIGDEQAAIGMNLSDRRILIAAAGAVEVFPFSALRFARAHGDGHALEIGEQASRIRQSSSTRLVAEMAFKGRLDHVFIELFEPELASSRFGRFAARQRGLKWLARLNQAARDERSSIWGSSELETTPKASGS